DSLVPLPRSSSSVRCDGRAFPLVITQFFAFVIFLLAAQAELTQTPFDMPVAESELVAGYMTEYSGFRFLFFFMGEFGTAFALSAIAATLFLCGLYLLGVHGSVAVVVWMAVFVVNILIVSIICY